MLLPQHTFQLPPLAYARLPPSWQLTAVPPLPWLRLRSPRRRVLPEGCLWPAGPRGAQLLPVRQSPPLPGYPPPLPAVDRSLTVTAIIAQAETWMPAVRAASSNRRRACASLTYKAPLLLPSLRTTA